MKGRIIDTKPLAVRKFPVIGLTGPMCAGKNAAADLLASRGYAVVDADVIAHEALEDEKRAVAAKFERIAREQGITLLKPDGHIDRRALGSLVFGNSERLASLESIIYPRINELLVAFIDAHTDRIVVINAPLLHKSPVLDLCTFVIFIDAWMPLRLLRAIKRDKLPLQSVIARFLAQRHLFSQYILKSVDIEKVHNRGSIRALERKLDTLLSRRGY